MALDAYIEAHRGDSVTARFNLVEIHLPVVQRLTDCTYPITHGGHVFSPAAVDVAGIESDSAGIRTGGGGITIAAGDDYWPALLAALTEEERHPIVVVYEAWLDPALSSLAPQAVRTKALLKLESYEVTSEEATLTLVPVAQAALGRLPSRDYGGGLCTYRTPGGPQCGAVAAAAGCARTPAACAAFSNTARFGGFATLPPEEVTLIWKWQGGEQLFEETLTLTRRDE